MGTKVEIHFTAVIASAFFTNANLILKTSNCLKAGSKNIKAPGELTHNNKHRHLRVLNSHSKRQTWACSMAGFAFSVNSETKSPPQKVVYTPTWRRQNMHMAGRPSPKPGEKPAFKSFSNFVNNLFLSL